MADGEGTAVEKNLAAGSRCLLKDGDRIELYRPLSIDPREARRQLALAGRTMREGEDENAG